MALTKRESKDSEYKAFRGLSISYIISIIIVLEKEKKHRGSRNQKQSSIKYLLLQNGCKSRSHEKGVEKRSDSGVL
jgi:hypothetical protein